MPSKGETRPKAVFALKSSAGFVPALVLTGILGLVGAAAGVFILSYGAPLGAERWLLAFMCGVLAFSPVAVWSSHRTYLVPGGNGELRLFTDRVELWSKGEGLTAFPMAELAVGLTQHVARMRMVGIAMADVNTDKHLTLQAGEQRIVLSQKLFVDQDVTQIAGAIERLRGGEELTEEPPPPPERDAWDDQLDRELAALDD